ncbi:ML domain-containing protein [Kitasatospora purpeofusca]|uniref:ML domain-containing protein n=1 Tax=Kitasatospora purpeofusca TaxID=67352 RepID=UPI002A59CA6C|nr:ML domain-containing protein [Kitasatospora purpeofusca]MDY0812405.1 ML domain-containing protein [Kitasatospora purpeofusca]
MAGWSYEDRGLPTDVFLIDSIMVTPDPPRPGLDVAIKVGGQLREVPDTDTYVDITVKLGLIKILQKRQSLSEFLAEWGASMPTKTGPFALELSRSLPREIPPAKFKIRVDGYTGTEEDAFCLEFTADFTKPSS